MKQGQLLEEALAVGIAGNTEEMALQFKTESPQLYWIRCLVTGGQETDCRSFNLSNCGR